MLIEDKFMTLATDNAPGQEMRSKADNITHQMKGGTLIGTPVDFSHGDVDAFEPTPGSFDAFADGVHAGGKQAYTEYRGSASIRSVVAGRVGAFTGAPVDANEELIITPGTQGALFLAVAATVTNGDKVAIVQPDYFANRKLVQFFGGEMVPVILGYEGKDHDAGINLNELEQAFEAGAKVFVFSNPNNPTGVVYSKTEIEAIAKLAKAYGATVIVDQLYSRLRYEGTSYTHLRALSERPNNLITIMGPSKSESLSGYRLGAAFGSAHLIERMEKLQAIVSLRASGYNQAVLNTWFNEPSGWMEERIRLHQAIRDDLVSTFRGAGLPVRVPQAGSYLFPKLPALEVGPHDFVKLLRHQTGVIATPGSEFGPHSLDSVRLNFSQDHTAAVAAVKRLVELVERYKK
ncbi:pyridoxal phosphate-dependent aminotransferase [Phyllobacterium endophyticum]|uniref:aspartate transaminase n=1 Tax=Phyllobacterium endophyticum TaxID=1149773 RepID=A0A2P7AKE0_9HYPH|nr:pyridoxal phosphate-dependent aminotransferase [Phyllobacterium endophyticum]MBB3237091.1 aspartate/methionine/tyrosine aminotransferase [Phyllobacterium endophyticum]PSH54673.1 aspartate aminotransferase [Phyllobacterium endophyticum]TYR40560.1 aminotransferase class I/II-fold pyridoxal phosphate-dependent enzyme [Phyllobacterium endophyticum]